VSGRERERERVIERGGGNKYSYGPLCGNHNIMHVKITCSLILASSSSSCALNGDNSCSVIL
jgi:hypothetical protein